MEVLGRFLWWMVLNMLQSHTISSAAKRRAWIKAMQPAPSHHQLLTTRSTGQKTDA
jgi:hypothetical protein